MTFAHPLFLPGALAALIPLLVHLFDRRRPRHVPFGAISFVLRSQKRTASRLKLKRLLLPDMSPSRFSVRVHAQIEEGHGRSSPCLAAPRV